MRKGTLAHRLQLSLLIGSNLLASIGGGKVLSAGEGITGLAILGSGSLLALLIGSAVGLGLLIVARRFLLDWALVILSLVTVLSSITLIALLWIDHLTASRVLTIWNGGSKPLSQPEAWLFFFGIVLRCALWFAGRSLRSDRAASLRSSWLAWTEAAYFFGLIIGFLIGHVAVAGQGNIVGSLVLDILLLSIAALADLFGNWTGTAQRFSAQERPVDKRMKNEKRFFWKLTAAFGASTIACQVVVLHVADTLAQTRQAALANWSNITVATFYLGVALSAVFCACSKPDLLREQKGERIIFQSGTWGIGIPYLLLITLAGILTLAGIFGIMTSSQEGTGLTAVGILALVALGSGAALFEILVFVLLRYIHTERSGAVALAFGIVATAAAIALFLMTLGTLHFSGWVGITVIGFAFTAWAVRGIKSLHLSTSTATTLFERK